MRRFAFFLIALTLTACKPALTSDQAPEQTSSAMSSASSAPQVPTSPPLEQTYTSQKERYEISYPAGWTMQEKTPSPMSSRLTFGTSFHPPKTFAAGTTFLDAMVYVDSNRTPCVQFVNPVPVKLGDTEFMKGNTSNVGTKNYQRMTMYTMSKDTTCYGVTLYVHGCNLNEGCGKNANRVNTFDPKALAHLFDRIVASFKPL